MLTVMLLAATMIANAEQQQDFCVFEAELAYLNEFSNRPPKFAREADTKAGQLQYCARRAENKNASGGYNVRFLGQRESNYLEWRDVHVANDGFYNLDFDFVSCEDRSVDVQIDGGAKIVLQTPFANDGGTVRLTVRLAAGSHTVRLSRIGAWAADFDRMRLSPVSKDFHAWSETPPMGWNSWDCYGSMVDEAAYKANADWQAKHLLRYGYEYCVVDIRWTVANETSANYNKTCPQYTLDEWGRYLPATNRFPSAAGGKGFKPLADYVHAQGLKFGIHVMRGVPKEAVRRKLPVRGCPGITCDMISNGKLECEWLNDNETVLKDRQGAQEYYDSIIELYADWGVDFIKCDDLSRPYHTEEVEMLRKAIDRCGRPIVLSTSPGRTPLEQASHVAAHANMWRMVDDLWDRWGAIAKLTDVSVAWLGEQSVAGAWPDCDMLPLGQLCLRAYGRPRHSRLTDAEARYLMTLMCIIRSPLMIGSDLPSLEKDPVTLALLTDKMLLDAHRLGRNVRCERHTREECVIVSDAPDGRHFVAFLNRTNSPRNIAAFGVELRLPPHGAEILLVKTIGK